MSRTAESVDASGSALDLRSSALLDPTTLLYGENMRRRGSDISRIRPTILVPEAIELTTVRDNTVVEEADLASVATKDVESAPGTPTPGLSGAPSTLDIGDGSSSAPFISGAERKRQRRKALLCFCSLCFCFFLAGWNDGSTGPLLPTIQRYYDVSSLRPDPTLPTES